LQYLLLKYSQQPLRGFLRAQARELLRTPSMRSSQNSYSRHFGE
jgi:hypothetical protein